MKSELIVNKITAIYFYSSSTSSLDLSTETEIGDRAKESLPAFVDGDNLLIYFNISYLLEGLKSIDSGKIKIELNGSKYPTVFTPVDRDRESLYLLMPVTIKS
ncbi:MAG: hypothetical protein HC778_04610 [Chamaesiphon sp. CSU_1_12]|nr:hypothetical protein [Chamaesiphon sp. CSU_1_12]